MKRLLYILSFLLIFAGLAWIDQSVRPLPRLEKVKKKPNDWFVNQRAYPQNQIRYDVYQQALRQAGAMKTQSKQQAGWNFVGPVNIGGRITDVEMHPSDPQTIYAGAASGGIFKSADVGQNWFPVFDDQISLSIGDIAIDPSNPNTIYAGTGESNAGGGSVAYGGMGVFKSVNGGQSWVHAGLEETRYIGRIVVDPSDSLRVFVAAMGKLFGTNPERGVYRSENGGLSWQQKLFVNDSTGCIDLVINPQNPDVLFAAMWERVRYPWNRSYGGYGSGIYRSQDGGDTWQLLSSGLPTAAPNTGRIGLAISQSNPQIVYAIYADDPGYFMGVYKTTNGGDSWSRVNDTALSSLFSSYGWWFGNIRVHPANPDIVYAMGLDIYRSTNGGQNWSYFSGSIHVDQHGLYIYPEPPYFTIAGNDGGIYLSATDAGTWNHVNDLPVTQFYTTETDQTVSNRYYGGTQDNGTLRTLNGNPASWVEIFGGDGFYALVDPENNQYVYVEYQWGNLYRSTNGGYSFYSATSGISGSDRTNWNTPVVFDPSNTSTLYYGANRLYKSTDRAQNWSPVSGDLSNGPGPGGLTYGTITTIAVAPADGNYIYVGTDDGNVWVTKTGGGLWLKRSAALPNRWVTRVTADPVNAEVAYVSFSGFRQDDYVSHLYRTENAGETWQDISSNLPEAPVNDIIVDPQDNSVLYAGTDVGVFVSLSTGDSWYYLGSGLPNVPVTDLVIHENDRKLVAATFGRSMYWYDLNQVPTAMEAADQTVPEDFTLHQNYPNPFNSSTTIEIDLKDREQVNLEIFSMDGRKVKTLQNGILAAGKHRFIWNGLNDNGTRVAGGTYIYRLFSGQSLQAGKMTHLP